MSETPDPFAPPPGAPPPSAQPPPPLSPYGAPPPGYAPPPAYAPPPPTGYPAPYGAPPAQGQGLPTGLAIAALVLGIVAALGFWIPFVGAITGLVALVLGVIAWTRAGRGRAGGKGMAIAGTLLGGLALLGGIVATVVIIWFVARTQDCYDPSFTDEQIERCIEDQFDNRFDIE